MTTPSSITVTVPGSTMLLGEHAVLYGYPAVVCAVDQYVTLTLSPRDDRKIQIHSTTLGEYETNLDALVIQKPFQFILASIMQWKDKLERGFDLEIASEFSDQIGLGSSAAVTVATLAAIQQWLASGFDWEKLHQAGIEVIRQVQGLGSGGDILASIYGGIIYYRADSLKFDRFKTKLPIHLIYSGYKTPTVEVVKKVEKTAHAYPKIFSKLFLAMGECVEAGKKAIQDENWSQLGEIFNMHQGLQEALGVNDKNLHDIISQTRAFNTVLGSKISGAGLGDCILALGDLPQHCFPKDESQRKQGVKQIPISVSMKGVVLKN